MRPWPTGKPVTRAQAHRTWEHLRLQATAGGASIAEINDAEDGYYVARAAFAEQQAMARARAAEGAPVLNPAYQALAAAIRQQAKSTSQ